MIIKNISISLPDLYIELLDKLGKERKISRSFLLRKAIEERINADLDFKKIIKELYPNLKREMMERRINDFHRYCIACNKKLKNSKNIKEIKDDNMIEVPFCADCYKIYENEDIDKLPEAIQEKIQMYFNYCKKLGFKKKY
ncbi:MAG: ribbon-helix-helix domain-containing protein [Promethearchaeota archaeon]